MAVEAAPLVPERGRGAIAYGVISTGVDICCMQARLWEYQGTLQGQHFTRLSLRGVSMLPSLGLPTNSRAMVKGRGGIKGGGRRGRERGEREKGRGRELGEKRREGGEGE